MDLSLLVLLRALPPGDLPSERTRRAPKPLLETAVPFPDCRIRSDLSEYAMSLFTVIRMLKYLKTLTH